MRFKINKKIMIMNIGILAAILCCFTFIIIEGDEYLMHSYWYFKDNKLVNVEPEFDTDGVVELTDYYIDRNDELILRLKSKGSGSVHAGFKVTEEFDGEIIQRTIYSDFRVGFIGVIIETSDYLNFGGYQAVIITLLVIMLMVEGVMLWMFLDYRKRGDFCYPMIASGGLAIFVFITLLFGVYKIFNNVVKTFGQFIGVISNVGQILLLALSPIMLTLAVLLAVSNIWLIRNEGFRPVNTLGIIFAVLWAAGTVFTLTPSYFLYGLPFFDYIHRFATYIICYFECMFISTVVCSFLAAKYKPSPDMDYIIILGCAIRADGSPTPLLRARVDSAAAFAEEQAEKTGKQAVFVPSGGQGSDEVISESESMERYMLEKGISADRILREDKSTNTFENMKFSREVIENHTDSFESKKIAFATTNYHIFRGYILAKKNGFEAKGISAKTKFYFYPNAFLREFIGLLADQKFRHLFFIAIVLLLFNTIFKG